MIDAKTLAGPDGLYPDDIAEILANADPVKKKMLRRIGRAVVDHDRHVRGTKWLEDMFSEHGTGLESAAGLFYGEPGVGKSTVLRKFSAGRAGPFETPGGSRRPVLLVEIPANPNEITLFDSFLRALGAEHLCEGKGDDRKLSVVKQLKLQHVQMIVMDEFTHLIEDRTENFTKKAIRHLKEMLNQGTCQIVFAGTTDLIKIHEFYGQMGRRDVGDFIMTKFDWNDADDQVEWCELLAVIAEVLGIPPSPKLDDPTRAKKLHRATDGNIDNLMKLLFRATAIAYDDGEPALTDQVFAEAFEFRRRASTKENPFGLPKRRRRKLTLSEAPAAPENEFSGLRKGARKPNDSFSKK
ncbi:AAA family ATPase [Methylobacterium sp. WL69]|uniref:TniB family NTP-binding protein n=1 Tax=Methylobacterium sp. WL69 TaxID=2603893 RepID=UPI0011C80F68|nr:TniB family NTP-binding protein [Methylobacterium sp. WL69]TXM73744.1 AAA family ATPase [Methylobacterium sp. WL69]